MYHTVHYDKQKKNIETIDHAEHDVKRLRSLLYNSRVNEERQLKLFHHMTLSLLVLHHPKFYVCFFDSGTVHVSLYNKL